MSQEDKESQVDAEHTDESNVEDDELDLDDEDTEDDDDADSDEEDESEDDLDDLEDEILKMTEEDLKDPANQAKALEALNKSKSAIKQKKLWRERAQKAGWKKEGNQPPAKKPANSGKPASQNNGTEEILRSNARIEFRQDHPDIPRRMVDEIETYAKAKGVTLEKALRRPLIQKMVNDKALKERLSKASPSSKHRSPQTKPPVDWSKATPEQVKAHTEAVRQAHPGRA